MNSIIFFDDEYFMREALKEAQKAGSMGEVPIGAVVVSGNRIIARGHNLTEQLNDVTAHAEMIAITSAFAAIGGKYLRDSTLYVTLEPCVMCAGALNWSQITRVVFGAKDDRRGASVFSSQLYHPKTQVEGGVMEEECSEIVKEFFRKKRR